MKRIVSVMSVKVKIIFVLLLALSVVASYATSCWPVLFASMVDGLSSGTIISLADIAIPLVLFAATCCAAKLLSILLRVGADVSAARFEADMQAEGFISALCLPSSSESLGRQSAELGSILAQGVEGCSQMYKLLVKDAIPVVLTSCFIGYQVAVSSSPIMLGIMAVFAILSFATSALQIRSQNGIRDGIILRHARLNGDVAQSIRHHEVIRASAAELFELTRLEPQINGIAQLESVHHVAMGRYDSCKQALEVILFVAVATIGVILMGQGLMTAGALVGTLMLCQQLVVPIDSVYRLLDEIATSKNKVSRLMEIVGEADGYLERDRMLDSMMSMDSAGNCEVAIAANDVSVLTPRGIAINEGIEFVAGAGDVLRFDGPTGCGKSSLVKALFNYNAHEGSLVLLGREVSNYSRKNLADAVFYLPQDSFIFSGTVRDNVAYGLDPDVLTDAELIKALERAQFTESEVGDLVEFLDRNLPENGKDLSGGQRQRLQAARLFLRHPKVLLADEPTASLDISTAKSLMKSMIEHVVSNGGTVCFVSHQEPIQAMASVEVAVSKGKEHGATHPDRIDGLKIAA